MPPPSRCLHTSLPLLASLLLAGAQAGRAHAQAPPLPVAARPDTTLHLALPHPPAWPRGQGPLLLFDEAHHNYHRTDGPYFAFLELLRQDGYRVQPLRQHWSQAALRNGNVLVVANPVSDTNAVNLWMPITSAFNARELKAMRDFVRGGGALFVITDHMPWAGADDALLAWFGIAIENGYALADTSDRSGELQFRRSDGGLRDHPITRGRNPEERVDSVRTFGGSAFRARGRGVEPLLVLPAAAVSLDPKVMGLFDEYTKRVPVGGWMQGAALAYGSGRVVVLAEAGLFAAPEPRPEQAAMGLRAAGAAQNAQFGLNILHWLTGLLPAR